MTRCKTATDTNSLLHRSGTSKPANTKARIDLERVKCNLSKLSHFMVKHKQIPFNYYIKNYISMTGKISIKLVEREKTPRQHGLNAGGKVASVTEQQKKIPIIIGGSK